MGESFIDYFTDRATDFTNVVNNVIFTISLLIVFYSVKGKSLKKNALFVAVHAVVAYVALLLLSTIIFMINAGTVYIVTVPKLLVMLVYNTVIISVFGILAAICTTIEFIRCFVR